MNKTSAFLILMCLALPLRAEHAFSLSNLWWLPGYWDSECQGEDSTKEEFWTSARGGMMLAVHRDAAPGQQAFFEYLRIEQRDDGLYYVASPGGGPATEFKAVKLADRSVVFENPEHDFPQRISYRLDGEGRLHVRISLIDKEKPFAEWTWARRP